MARGESLRNRHRRWLGGGGETTAWKLERGQPEVGKMLGGSVLKAFEGHDARHAGWEADRTSGFNDPVRVHLENSHRRLKSQYGDAILPCRIIPNPDEPGRFFLIQPHADPKNQDRLKLLLDQSLNDVQQPQLQERIAKFTTSLKANYERWVRGDKAAVVPDIEKANIIIDAANERFYYIDNETMDTPYYGGKKLNRWFDLENVAARLEMMSGKTPQDIIADPFYQALFEKYSASYPNWESAQTDQQQFFELLSQMGSDIRAAAIEDFNKYMARAK